MADASNKGSVHSVDRPFDESRVGHTTDIVGIDLEIDSSGSTPSSGHEEGYISAGTSLSSSTTDFRYENGRRYHAYKDGQYHLPNDEQEADRLELQHRIWIIMLNGKLHLAPIKKNLEDVLDVGTGTGSWAIDFATAYPDAQVLGTDLSPIQPTNAPPNCSFLIDDASQDWTFGRHFDYIHARALTIGIRNWDHFFKQCWDTLKPGGWLEMQEWTGPLQCDDDSCPPNTPIIEWCNQYKRAAIKLGIDLGASTTFTARLQKLGFINIQEVRGKWAVGTWPKGKREKKIGELFQTDMMDVVEAATLRFYSKELGWSEEDIWKLISDLKVDVMNPKRHLYMPIYIFIAQKPDPGQKAAPEMSAS